MSSKPTMVLSLVLFACGNQAEPTTPTTPTTPSEAPPVASSAPAASAEPEPAKRRKPFEIYSACSDVVTIAFGEDPKAATAGKRTLAPSVTIEGPRNADGNQIVWLLDTKEEALVKVNVTRGMKRVEIGRSCRTLDAR
jgi:hypothetical protein